MATYKKTNSRPKSTAKSSSAASTKKEPVKTPQKKNTLKQPEKKKRNPDSIWNQVLPYVLGLCAFAVAFCLIFKDNSGFIGKSIVNPLLCGLFGWGSAIIAPLILIQGILWRKSVANESTVLKFVSSLFVLLSFSIIIHVITIKTGDMSVNMKTLWQNGTAWSGGGAIGGIIAVLCTKAIDKALTLCIFIPLMLVFSTFLFGFTPYTAVIAIRDKIRDAHQKIEEYEGDEGFEGEPKVWHSLRDKKKLKINEDALEPDKAENTDDTSEVVDMTAFDEAVREKEKKKQEMQVDVPVDDNAPFNPDVALDDLVAAVNNATSETITPINTQDTQDGENSSDEGVPDAKELELMVERKQIQDEQSAPVQEKEPQPVREYVFPPMSFLPAETNTNNEDVSEEMRSTAIKLVETLRSFKVKTRIIDVSRGPSITRYELAPEEGVRVRTIANLVDDISLNLATSGVRIEAPIPGKAAVGIEVPNKNVSIVYLKELLEHQLFKNAKSRVTVALGMDVAGTPIYVDIAKMPHLLIAGATGMGKSVCINSMIVSLLYKATPDEVKLILIDPKKVELSMYNGLPHLLVPVVTDPKKAAGSLHWAVGEMDRRFELIESVGVRDVASYNRITKDDPEKEFLPQIIIVIDELADLMMTAPKEVEDSICRIAQKARAAGMHLVIGTQRPSVDVVTGLIKANVPSRIAFTMASQVDSRTIIDIAGAEKLIGRGDMLYAPVGFAKPARVQGAFVTDVEIEKVVNFIKETSGVSSYDARVIESIEKEALKCGEGKNAGGDDGDDEGGDPLFRSAVELAIESGKISTSLLQRRLSVGYGRAAKLIDKMQQKGIVSPPDGSKPRTVLISRQDFLESAFKNEE